MPDQEWKVTVFKTEKLWDFKIKASSRAAAEAKARAAVQEGAAESEKGDRDYFTVISGPPGKDK